jgi:hypothetical protein
MTAIASLNARLVAEWSPIVKPEKTFFYTQRIGTSLMLPASEILAPVKRRSRLIGGRLPGPCEPVNTTGPRC